MPWDERILPKLGLPPSKGDLLAAAKLRAIAGAMKKTTGTVGSPPLSSNPLRSTVTPSVVMVSTGPAAAEMFRVTT